MDKSLGAFTDIAISPDGTHAFAVVDDKNALYTFSRNTTTGELSFVQVLKDGVNGVDGLDGAWSVTVSPDNQHVYVAAGFPDDAVLVFSRNTSTGELSFVQVLKDGIDGVDGLDGAESVTVSPDSQHVYVAANSDDAVSVFRRNTSTGELSFVQALKDGVDGVDGLDRARSVTVSPDNQHVYVAASVDDAVSIFEVVPFVTLSVLPNLLFENATTSIIVKNNHLVNNVELIYKRITASDNSSFSTLTTTENNGTYSATLTSSLDDIGIEYFFRVNRNDGGTAIETNTQLAYVYHSTGLDIGSFSAWNGIEDNTNAYRIVSVPLNLDQKSVNQVFEEAGTLSDETFMLYQFNNTTTERPYSALGSSSFVNAATPYWFITASSTTVNTGAGSTEVKSGLSKTNPYTVSLIAGWNMIGNPYNFDLSWSAIVDHNSSLNIDNNFTSYTGSYFETNTLSKYTGGWIFSNETSNVTLEIPTQKNLNGGSRIAETNVMLVNPLHEENWEVRFSIDANGTEQVVSGFGMRTDAAKSKDTYDRMTLPRFLSYSEMYSNHPEFFYPKFSRDVVPTQNEYTWEFNYESNVENEDTQLQWNNSYFGQGDYQLLLYDEARDVAIDMRKVENYTFDPSFSSKFKVYYTKLKEAQNPLLPKEISLGRAYPNPFTSLVSIPFSLPQNESYTLELTIYSLNGQRVKTLEKGGFSSGFYESEWDGNNESGVRVASGIYLYKLEAKSTTAAYTLHGRLLLK